MSSSLLGSLPAGRANNADLLRFLAASGVVVSHAFALSGHMAEEPVMRWSGGKANGGALMVSAFFILSGYLITQSFLRRRDRPLGFVLARVRRLAPALIVCVLATVFLIGPAMTTLPTRAYFANPQTWDYLRAVTLWHLPLSLPGVFEGAPYASHVNGSLWTLWYEMWCYWWVLALGLAGLLRRSVALVVLPLLIALAAFVPALTSPFALGLPFACGAFFALAPDRPRLTWWGVALAVGLIVAGLGVGRALPVVIALPGSYLVLGFVFHPWPWGARWAELAGGDLSYGIYIYAWPIQQAVWYVGPNPTMPVWLHFAISYPLILLCAKVSWQWIERPALRASRAAPRAVIEVANA